MLLLDCVALPEPAVCLWLVVVALRTVVPVLETTDLDVEDVRFGAAVAELFLPVTVLLTRFVDVDDALVEVLPSLDERSLREVDEVPSPPRRDERLPKTLSEPVSCLSPVQVSTC